MGAETKPTDFYPIPVPSTSQSGYNTSLFPTSMFPSLSLYGMNQDVVVPQQGKEPPRKESEELFEIGVLLAILKLASG
jgi:hypothetical protein